MAVLLPVFVTGPIGALVGALWGVARLVKPAHGFEWRVKRWSTPASTAETASIVKWLVAICLLTLLYTLCMIGLTSFLARGILVPAIILQGLVAWGGIFLWFATDLRARLSEPERRYGTVALVILVLILLMTLFPPVVGERWDEATTQVVRSTVPRPRVAFVLDARLVGNGQGFSWAVDTRTLFLEVVIALVAGLALCLVLRRPRHAGESSQEAAR